MSVEATGRTVVKEEMNTDQIVGSESEAPCQLEQSQLKSMKVSVDRGGTTTTATVQSVKQGHNGLQNRVESGIGGLRSAARHQAE